MTGASKITVMFCFCIYHCVIISINILLLLLMLITVSNCLSHLMTKNKTKTYGAKKCILFFLIYRVSCTFLIYMCCCYY